MHHQLDFGVQADWAFSATSHGKGPWDGLAGSAKREATIESLQRPLEKQIQTADDFFRFVAKIKEYSCQIHLIEIYSTIRTIYIRGAF